MLLAFGLTVLPDPPYKISRANRKKLARLKKITVTIRAYVTMATGKRLKPQGELSKVPCHTTTADTAAAGATRRPRAAVAPGTASCLPCASWSSPSRWLP